MTTRLNNLPDPAFLELRPKLLDRLAKLGAEIHAEEFKELLTPLICDLLRKGVAEACAQEGSIWIVDEAAEHLVPAFNTGPNAERIVGKFQQPLSSGLISMVFASEQSFVENAVPKNPSQSRLLDSLLQVKTISLIAVPFYFLGACRGILSCVQLEGSGGGGVPAPEFGPRHLASMQRTASLISHLIEHDQLSTVVGWKYR